MHGERRAVIATLGRFNGRSMLPRAMRPQAVWLLRWSIAISFLFVAILVLSAGAPITTVWWLQNPFGQGWPHVPLPSRVFFLGFVSTGVMAVTLLTFNASQREVRRIVERGNAPGAGWVAWLGLSAVSVAILARLIGVSDGGGSRLAVCAVLGVLAVTSWCLAAMPAEFWRRWAVGNRKVLPAAVLFGVVGYVLVGHAPLSMPLLQRATASTCRHLLMWFTDDIVYQPDLGLLGTSTFAVYIEPACAGWEGVTFFALFYGLNLWIFRKTLRFPQVLILLPLGAAALWFLNDLRIVLLILLGGWSEWLAMYGFHAIGGWLFFNLVTLAMVAATRHFPIFTRDDATGAVLTTNPAAPFLVPLLTVIAIGAIANGAFGGFNLLYPVGVMAGSGALMLYWKKIPHNWTPSLSPIAFGLAAFLLLMLVRWAGTDPAGAADASIRTGLNRLSGAVAATWILFRLLGHIALAPISEELAFRGYAMRKLISIEFEKVSLTQFTWLSFLGSSMLFGALHSQWLVETFIGMIFAVAVYNRGLIWDGIVAHSLTNTLLATYVIATGHWSLLG